MKVVNMNLVTGLLSLARFEAEASVLMTEVSAKHFSSCQTDHRQAVRNLEQIDRIINAINTDAFDAVEVFSAKASA